MLKWRNTGGGTQGTKISIGVSICTGTTALRNEWVTGRYPSVVLVSIALSIAVTLSSSQELLRAEGVDKPAVPPQPRTINLPQEQRFIIKENVKDLDLLKAPKDAPETIGDPVPQSIELYTFPPEVATKVSQARSHSFFIKEGNNAIVLVSPNDRRVADVIR
jgi:hypothetical protein